MRSPSTRPAFPGRARDLLRSLGGAHRRLLADPERGTTLVEVVVAMTIMVICGSIFTGAVVSLNRTSNQAQAITNAATQNNQAYQTLERTVRYVSAVSTPGTSAGNWYVELRDTTSGAEICTQLRLNTATQQLQSRSWTVTTPVAASAWTPIASGVTNGGAASGTTNQPFALPTQAARANRQQLRITLIARAGPASQPVSSTSSYVLTALNSTMPPPTGAICQQMGRS